MLFNAKIWRWRLLALVASFWRWLGSFGIGSMPTYFLELVMHRLVWRWFNAKNGLALVQCQSFGVGFRRWFNAKNVFGVGSMPKHNGKMRTCGWLNAKTYFGVGSMPTGFGVGSMPTFFWRWFNARKYNFEFWR